MEKSTATRRKLGFRLLICLALIYLKINLLFATPTYEYLNTLQFKKQDTYFFSGESGDIFLKIDDISPDSVSVSVNSLPDSMSFLSSKKESFVENGTQGTKITLSFRFKKTGRILLSPIEVRVNNIFLHIPVESFFVYENPATILPTISVYFNKTPNNKNELFVTEGEHINFTLYARYASAITKFSWTLPENSLFAEVRRFDILNENEKPYSFSSNEIPIAEFDWQPLVQGDFALPEINISALAYNGTNVNLKLPEYKIIVNKNALSLKGKTQNSLSENFKDAFSEPKSPIEENAQGTLSEKSLDLLISLHSKELHSLPFSKARKNRIEAEQNAALIPSDSKPSIPLFIITLFFCIVFLILTLLLFIFKNHFSEHKNLMPLIFAVLFFLNLGGMIYTGLGVKQKFAVFAGGEMRVIPEEQSKAGVYIPKGSCVRVKRVLGDWTYISYNKTTGWVYTDSVYFIK